MKRLSQIHPKTEVQISRVSTAITAGLFLASLFYVVGRLLHTHHLSPGIFLANILFLFLITIFAYGNILYQLTRTGYYRRLGESDKSSYQQEINYTVGHRAPQLSVLIPSYKEEVATVMQTLVSAAVMGYPCKDVSLLLDDPVARPGTADYLATQQTLKMVEDMQRRLDSAYASFNKLATQAAKRLKGNVDFAQERQQLALAYKQLSGWLYKSGTSYAGDSHTDKVFIDTVFMRAAEIYKQRAAMLASSQQSLGKEALLKEYLYIRNIFDTELRVIQRKKYQNLSHEPNKAMNINSYISLMGGSYQEEVLPGGRRRLEPAETGDVQVPGADYVITLDADSLLDHTYAATLIRHMEEPGNERVAVAQTPYSAIRGTENLLERTAGATTDIMYIIHQGFTAHGATYWVGANALIRVEALVDIAEPIEGEEIVCQFIQDRTVIEDTESSIDLIRKGWTLHNHPARLAYSATPPDYGSLLIQRRRWANGGFIILPKLISYLVHEPSLSKATEGFMRVHYLASIMAVNLGLTLMLLVPLQNVAFSLWVPLTAAPYFYLYNRDLRILGYDKFEILRVYALNLLLVPINLGGVFKSFQQIVTRAKIPFGRTPKVGRRTAAPPIYHLFNYAIFGYLTYDAWTDLATHRYIYTLLLLANVSFLGYALVYMVGIREAVSDLTNLRSRLTQSYSLVSARLRSRARQFATIIAEDES